MISALVVIGLSYVVCYGIWRARVVTGSYADFFDIPTSTIISYFAESDPFIVYMVLPLTLFRVLLFLRYPDRQKPYDAFLISAAAYASAYFALRLYSPYYMLPAYGFAAVGMAGALADFSLPGPRVVITALVAMFTINGFPVFVSDLQTQKQIANNHGVFVEEMAEWLVGPGATSDSPRHLVLAGVNPGNFVEIINSLAIFLRSLGVPEAAFNIGGSEATTNPGISAFFKVDAGGRAAVVGDVLIFNPYREPIVPPPTLSPSYRPLFRSVDEWTLPRWRAMDWMNQCLLHPTHCSENIVAGRRYAGYAAFLVVRDPVSNLPLVPLTAPSFHIGVIGLPQRLRVGDARPVRVMVRNTGSETWVANGKLQSGKFVNLSYRWFDESGRLVLEGNRAALPEPMQPGDVAEVSLTITTPKTAGHYRLAIGPLQEEVTWFVGSGDRWLDVTD